MIFSSSKRLRREFQGKTALVTGASRGLGAKFALQLAGLGCDLILVARRTKWLLDVKEEIQALSNVNVHIVSLDLAEKGAARKLYDEVSKRGLKPDILINNAGRSMPGGFHDISAKSQLDLIDLNVYAPTELTLYFGQDMIRRGYGRILMVSSVVGFQGGPYFAVYAASKAFLSTLGEGLSYEHYYTGVTSTTLVPGMINTEFYERSAAELTKYKRLIMMSTDDVARIGITALMRGKHCVIAGGFNKVVYVLGAMLPRWARARIAHTLMISGKWFTTRWGERRRAQRNKVREPGLRHEDVTPAPGE